MQRKTNKTLYLRNKLAETIKALRISKNCSGNNFANEYDIGNGTLYRIENALIDCKFITLWKIAEALDMKLSHVIKIVEDEVGEDFHLTDL